MSSRIFAKKAAVLVELQRPLARRGSTAAPSGESATLVRSEIRHREKMKRFSYTPSDEPVPDPWREILPHLDDAINALSAPDRTVLMQHWFERRTFCGDRAKMRRHPRRAVQRRGLRALDKLVRPLLRRRGAVVPAALLAAGLTPQLTHAAPAGMAAAVSAACRPCRARCEWPLPFILNTPSTPWPPQNSPPPPLF